MAKNALITGASKGIGKELALVFAYNGYDVHLVARSKKKLESVAELVTQQTKRKATVYALDLANHNAASKIFKAVGKDIDVLVNNAGFGDTGFFEEMDWERHEDLLQVNLMNLTKLTHLYLPHMKKRGSGGIMNVSSVFAMIPAGPLMAVYAAAKSYVKTFTRTLHYECKGSGIHVTTLAPGAVNTEFWKRAGASDDLIPKQTPAQVARAGYRGLMRNKSVVVPGITAKAMALFAPMIPAAISAPVIRFMNARKLQRTQQ